MTRELQQLYLQMRGQEPVNASCEHGSARIEMLDSRKGYGVSAKAGG